MSGPYANQNTLEAEYIDSDQEDESYEVENEGIISSHYEQPHTRINNENKEINIIEQK